VEAGEVLRGDDGIADVRAVAGEEVDDAGREAGLLEQLHRVVRREELRAGGLPEDGVAHQAGAAGRLPAMLVKLNGVTARTNPPAGGTPPGSTARGAERLVPVDLVEEVDVVAEEVDELAGGVDLGLEGVLALPEHGGDAFSRSRYGPTSRSAARRKMAARMMVPRMVFHTEVDEGNATLVERDHDPKPWSSHHQGGGPVSRGP
jgi:hypothetical protein